MRLYTAQKGGDCEIVAIMSWGPHHDEKAVLCAAELALEAAVPTKTHILNLLHRLMDGTHTDLPEVDHVDALALKTVSKTDVGRSDKQKQTVGKRPAS